MWNEKKKLYFRQKARMNPTLKFYYVEINNKIRVPLCVSLRDFARMNPHKNDIWKVFWEFSDTSIGLCVESRSFTSVSLPLAFVSVFRSFQTVWTHNEKVFAYKRSDRLGFAAVLALFFCFVFCSLGTIKTPYILNSIFRT